MRTLLCWRCSKDYRLCILSVQCLKVMFCDKRQDISLFLKVINECITTVAHCFSASNMLLL